ncbi:2',3'-cyclic-nucleotide 2'-phosphodiesterase / 3'-nucleotidase [Thermanaeromonas toyohensis ToBE]|uniref:2',3'-cyclic-nucleotide 2'-phosphodiesterase / 3'-nucleotidase n=1 Tax=Thermanaeromonas toyohensis ToBE TaxID=698762 RepID=A0A1W1VZH2_9FIRM|nr:bifunctional 2',3'-cyclic-nucleotide 2'-phosphodiesterase/3'-nucleotidase [Thermanaeromonas toyohensis]SMB98757.1 2',3'-cyclic-nucleotide 2'-phosphodiesterase / 3'-nucleotidase [Thermanaeromonas toyohensis ToBE]
MLLKRSKLISLLIIIVLFNLFSISPLPLLAEEQNSSYELVILATTDLHGNIYPWDYYKNAPANYGLAKIATLVKEIRAKYPNALLFDNGDLVQGTPLAYYYARVNPLKENEVHPIIAVMNYIGYNAATIGNHEFNYGLPFLEQVIKGAKFPYVLANVYKSGTTIPYFTPYTIIEVPLGKDKVKVGVIGFTPPGIMIWDRANLEGKVETGDIIEAAKRFIPEMKAKGADVIVALAHSGISGTSSYDEKATGLGVENAVKLLAQQVDGIDLIIAGHSHQEIPGKVLPNPLVGNTLILQPGYWGNNLAWAKLTLEKTETGWKVIERNGKLLSTKDIGPDPEVLSIAREAHEKTLKFVTTPLGKTETPITTYSARLADTAAIQLINEIQMERVKEALKGTKYENLPIISAAAPFKAGRNGPTDFTDIRPGQITMADVASLYIYDNTLVAIKINGAQLKAWLEHAAENFRQVVPSSGTEALINTSFPAYNFDQIDGVSYVIDITKPVGERIVELTYNGQPVTPQQEFILVTNNYRAGGGGNFPGTGKEAVIVYDRQEETRVLIADFIKKHESISPWPDYNWRIKENFLNHWAAKPATTLLNRGILRGDAEGRLFLDKPTTRAEFVTLLIRSLGDRLLDASNPFQDIKNHWAEKYITTAAALGITSGIGEGKFGPDNFITRQEAISMIIRARLQPGELDNQSTTALSAFKDGDRVAPWAMRALSFAIEHGILGGYETGELRPEAPLLRGEAAKIIYLSIPELLPPNQAKLTLITLNDFHGRLEEDPKKAAGAPLGAARLTTALLGEKWLNPGGVLLLNAGDTYQGTPISNLVYGQSVNEWQNLVGFNAMTIGNHEFDWGVKVLKQRIKEANFPVIAANIYDKTTNQPVDWIKPTAILQAAGVKVGIIGATTQETASIVMPANVEGLKFPNPASRFDELVSELKGGGAEVVIGLTHLGSEVTSTGELAGEARDVLDQMKDHLDALITGHTHREIATIYKGTPVVQALSYGKAYGKIELYYDKQLKKVVRASVEVIKPSPTLYPNPEASSLVQKWKEVIGPKVNTVIARTVVPLSKTFTSAGESVLGDLIADAQRYTLGADIAIMNGGGIRADINLGDITWGELYSVQPFGNVLFKVPLTGAQIKQVLEEGIENYYRLYNKLPRGHLPVQVSGIKFTWDYNKPFGQRIILTSLKLEDGSPLDLNKTYIVAVNEFVATGGDDFNTFKTLYEADKKGYYARYYTGIVDLDALIAYLQKLPQPIKYNLQNRIAVVNFPGP